MSTPALNPLVTKIRAAYPGAYDDMDDATLTKSVLAKYPQYSDLAAPPVPNPIDQIRPEYSSSTSLKQEGATTVPRMPRSLSPTMATVAGGAMAGGAALAGGQAAGAVALPFLKSMAAKHPMLTALAGQELINQARQIPGIGKYVPKYAEWLPFLAMGGKGETPPEGGAPLGPEAPTPELMQSQKLSQLPPTGAKPVAQTGEALAQIRQKLNMEPTPQAPPITKKAVGSLLEKGLDAAPPPEPGKPIYQGAKPAAAIEHTPVQSSALKSFAYDPAQKELHIATNSNPNTVYVYGDVAPEQANALATAESKGKAYGDFRKSGSPLVAKIIDGKRVAVKPTARPQNEPTATPDNQLVEILKKSVAQAKGMAAD